MTPDQIAATVLARRNRMAFLDGVQWELSRLRSEWTGTSASEEAAKRYPIPTVTQPRVVADPVDPRARWQVWPNLVSIGAELGVAHPAISDGDFYAPTRELSVPTTARVKMWADLLANPTETVEASL